MILAGMIREDKNSWICDMAETYNIYDYKRVPVKMLGILSAGLREDSRIRQKLEGLKAPPDTIIMAKIYDLVNILLWSKTKDAEKISKPPISICFNVIDIDGAFISISAHLNFLLGRTINHT